MVILSKKTYSIIFNFINSIFVDAMAADNNDEVLNELDLKTGQTVSSSNESGKIVNNYYCYIATVVDSEESKHVKVNDKLIFFNGRCF